MRAYIISDHEPTAGRVREVLLRAGCDCPQEQVVPVHRATDAAGAGAGDLVVAVLPPDPPRVLAALAGLRPQSGAGVLAVGPTMESRLVLQALRGGASDFVDEAELEAELRAALARLRSAAGAQAEPGRLIALLSPSGGSGSSTLAANLATVLAKEHKSTALLDLKHASGNLADLLDLKPAHTIADLCLNAAQMDRVMFERSLVRHASGVSLLAPAQHFADVAHVTPDGVRQVVTLARDLFPYVLADLDYSYRDEEAQVLRLADLVLLVLRLDFSSLRHAQRALEYLKHLGLGPERVRLVANRYGRPKEVPARTAEEALGVRICHYVPDDPKTVNRANNNGVPLVIESPWARVSRSLRTLAHGINGHPPDGRGP
jgi:pilus assembly protein CpaE